MYEMVKDETDLRSVERYGSGKGRFTCIQIQPRNTGDTVSSVLLTGGDLEIEVEVEARENFHEANVALIIYDLSGYRLIDVNTALRGSFLSLRAGERASVNFVLQNVLLKSGLYLVGLWLGCGSIEDLDGITYARTLSIEPNPAMLMHTETFPGIYQCHFSHTIKTRDQ